MKKFIIILGLATFSETSMAREVCELAATRICINRVGRCQIAKKALLSEAEITQMAQFKYTYTVKSLCPTIAEESYWSSFSSSFDYDHVGVTVLTRKFAAHASRTNLEATYNRSSSSRIVYGTSNYYEATMNNEVKVTASASHNFFQRPELIKANNPGIIKALSREYHLQDLALEICEEEKTDLLERYPKCNESFRR